MKKILIAISILIVLILLVVSNPSKEDFITWVREEVTKEVKGDNKVLVDFGFDIFGDKVINSATTSSNFVLFSIYDVKLSDDKNIKVVGVFNNFISKDLKKLKEEVGNEWIQVLVHESLLWITEYYTTIA